MTPLLFAGIAVAGGLGAACRLFVDALVRSRIRTRFPVGTLLINVTGSFLLGLVVTAVIGQALPAGWGLVLGTGLLGGYTTFSTASVETVRLMTDRRYGLALGSSVGMLIAGMGAGALGLWLGAIGASALP
ncbi:fluoride efflux transporter FluC [Planctomonas psychrotolerans]|uniref:fluoride efflux transporter FluC n=1 Tax=Planctomonas psychrotolerans TaxID=2528712 RepID=UPI00123895CE|nr:CrcB family protein [Planctomonas psychrotolerans]